MLQEDSQAVPSTWKWAGSPQNEQLSGQQVLKLLLLVLSSKNQTLDWEKGVTTEHWERIWTRGNTGISLFRWSSCLQEGILIYSLNFIEIMI